MSLWQTIDAAIAAATGEPFAARDRRAVYRQTYPLASGYEVRRSLYTLYHVRNHFNLFGDGYGAQAEHLVDALLAELG